MFVFKIYLFIIYLAALGLSCGTRALRCGVRASVSWCAVSRAHGLSSCNARALENVGSVVAVHGLSCPAACGILVSRPGSNPLPLHWKANS